MQVRNITSVTKNFVFSWPGGDEEKYKYAVEYLANSTDGEHEIRLGFGIRAVYGSDRTRVVVWIDDRPHAEFFGAEDFNISGEVLSEIRLYDEDNNGIRMCRYGSDVVPERYMGFNVDSLRRRVNGVGVHDAWAVVANIADHLTMIRLACLRRWERE